MLKLAVDIARSMLKLAGGYYSALTPLHSYPAFM
jgi:hypothetical protein